MYDLDAMATFVAVIRSGRFAAASKFLGIPKSTVSQRVARLEATLGVRLLERTTRVLRPTSAGAAYYERCARILADVDDANASVKDLARYPRGLLRVAAPHLLGQAMVAAVASTFCRTYPEIEVEIIASDGRVSLLEDGFDIAIAATASEADSSTVTRVLGKTQTWCCAARSYLEHRLMPGFPEELTDHDCIIRDSSGSFGRDARWSFERGDDVRHVNVSGRLRLNSISMAHAAVLAGAGIAAIPSFLCAHDVQNGRLVRILRDWVIEPKDIRILYPSHKQLSPRVRLFIDALITAAECDERFG